MVNSRKGSKKVSRRGSKKVSRQGSKKASLSRPLTAKGYFNMISKLKSPEDKKKLITIAAKNNIDISKYLINTDDLKILMFSVKKYPELVHLHTSIGDKDTLLHRASEIGDVSTVKKLIKLGANVNAKNKRGMTPLHVAGFYSTPDKGKKVVDVLLKSNANPNIKNKYGKTAIEYINKL